MLNIVPDHPKNETLLTEHQIKNWSFVIIQLHNRQLWGLKKPLPSKPKTIADIMSWIDANRSSTLLSFKIRTLAQYFLPGILYLAGGLWLSTIFSALTIALYFVPFVVIALRTAFQYHSHQKQFMRLSTQEHTDELHQKIHSLQQEALQEQSQTPPSFSTDTGLIFSYMVQKDDNAPEYHIISFRSITESLSPHSVSFLSLVAKLCLPSSEAPIVFKAQQDIFHILYTHDAQTPFSPPEFKNRQSDDILNDLWLVIHHQQAHDTKAHPTEDHASEPLS